MKWIESAGGPLVLVPATMLERWGGVDESSSAPDDAASDYDRACDVTGYVGVLSVGTEDALVLGDEPHRTTWIPDDDARGGLIARWVFGVSEESVQSRLRGSIEASWDAEEPIAFRVSNAPLMLFDAALPGLERGPDDDAVEIALIPGAYVVQTATYEPDAETSLVLHRVDRT